MLKSFASVLIIVTIAIASCAQKTAPSSTSKSSSPSSETSSTSSTKSDKAAGSSTQSSTGTKTGTTQTAPSTSSVKSDKSSSTATSPTTQTTPSTGTVKGDKAAGTSTTTSTTTTTATNPKAAKAGAPSTSTSSTSNSSDSKQGTDKIVEGLKETLKVAATNSANKLSITDAFFKNNAIKILMPPEVKDVETKLRSLGMGKMVDDAVLRMNRAAETAAHDAGPIFLNAITSMSFSDASGILTGPNDAATQYLKKTTSVQLTDKFKPVIKSALDKTEATKYWGDVFNQYNKIPFVTKVNPDLTSYVTGKALDGLFYTLAGEEAQIRKDPAGTANSIIESIFGH